MGVSSVCHLKIFSSKHEIRGQMAALTPEMAVARRQPSTKAKTMALLNASAQSNSNNSNKISGFRVTGRIEALNSGTISKGKNKGQPFRTVRLIEGKSATGKPLSNIVIGAYGDKMIAAMDLPETIPAGAEAGFFVRYAGGTLSVLGAYKATSSYDK